MLLHDRETFWIRRDLIEYATQCSSLFSTPGRTERLEKYFGKVHCAANKAGRQWLERRSPRKFRIAIL